MNTRAPLPRPADQVQSRRAELEGPDHWAQPCTAVLIKQATTTLRLPPNDTGTAFQFAVLPRPTILSWVVPRLCVQLF